VHQHQVGYVLADLRSHVDRLVVAQCSERIEHDPSGVTEWLLEFVEMFDRRSGDGHRSSRFEQADRLSIVKNRSSLEQPRVAGPRKVRNFSESSRNREHMATPGRVWSG